MALYREVSGTLPHFHIGWRRVVFFAAGSVLLVAAAAKTHELRVRSLMGLNGELTLKLSVVHIFFELLLASWLFSGIRPRGARIVAASVFALYAVVSLGIFLSGGRSCRCFGLLEPHPLLMTTLDVVSAALLLRTSPLQTVEPNRRIWRATGFSGSMVLLLSLAVILVIDHFGPKTLIAGANLREGDVIAMDPTRWVGSRLPLLDLIPLNCKLKDGPWTVLLYRPGCRDCDTALPRFLAAARLSNRGNEPMHFAVFSFPSTPDADSSVAVVDSRVLTTYAAPRHVTWQVPAPLVLHLCNGQVVAVDRDAAGILPAITRADAESRKKSAWMAGHLDLVDLRRQRHQQTFACGPSALLAILESMGRRPEETAIERMMAIADSGGTTFDQLRRLAAEQGFHPVGVFLTTSQLRYANLPAIAHLSHGTFVAVLGFEEEGVWLADANGDVFLMPDVMFEKHFGPVGRALLILPEPPRDRHFSAVPRDSQRAKHIRSPLEAHTSLLTLGSLPKLEWSTKLHVFNRTSTVVSNIAVTVDKDGRNGCSGLVQAVVSCDRITPGAAAIVTITGRQHRPGAFQHELIIKADQTDYQLRVPIRGLVEPTISFDRPTHTAEARLVGQPHRVELPFAVPKHVNWRTVKAAVTGVSSAELAILQVADRPVIRVCARDLPVGVNRLTLSLRPGDDDSLLPATLSLKLPVLALVEFFPKSISFDSSPRGDQLQVRSIAWVRRDGNPKGATPRFTSPNVDGGRLTGDICARTNTLVVRYVAADRPNPLVNSDCAIMRLTYSDGVVGEIPVYFENRQGRLFREKGRAPVGDTNQRGPLDGGLASLKLQRR